MDDQYLDKIDRQMNQLYLPKLYIPEGSDLLFENGHGKGLTLKSFNPDKTNEFYDLPTTVSKVEVGDKVVHIGGGTKVISEIDNWPIGDESKNQTFILRVEKNNNFYANGILVHNK